ncbi:hypothetical protein F4804DRAFT_345895 [Jackrogersella minutella]|nr:hypothetical protein F4804DRAFT_345895 [Jackrogersella minutella]
MSAGHCQRLLPARDIVAFTSHLRTFSMPSTVAAALLHLKDLRGVDGNVQLVRDAHFAVMSPVMMFIDCGISFTTISPALSCMGKMVLLPVWILSTWVENLVQQLEDVNLLSSPSRNIDDLSTVETDVFIIGAGSSPYRLTQHDVAEDLRQYATNFHLNVILSTTIHSTSYNSSEKKWTIKLKTADGGQGKTIISKQFVQATGIGCQKPYLPLLEDEHLFEGLSVHSAHFRNARSLSEQGIKSVVVISSANTAFDVMQECYNAGLKTTMVARSPTYIFPYEYVMDPHGIGAYDNMPLDVADRLLKTFPLALDGQFSHGPLAHLASQEPDRYLALAQAGFPVLDSRDPSADVQHHLAERGGGHYIDVGAVRGRVGPVGYTKTRLRLSDGSVLDANAVIWCTGFADKDVRAMASEVLGMVEPDATNDNNVLGPKDIAARLDASWGVDAEGEVRGVWKHHLRMENYWTIGGVIQQQRWWSRLMTSFSSDY